MPARVAHGTKFVVVTFCLVAAGTRPATAQALCPQAGARSYSDADGGTVAVRIPSAPYSITVEADLRAVGDNPAGGAWRMPVSGAIASDALALEGVSLRRSTERKFGSNVHTIDVVVELRAADNLVTDLEFVVVDGERTLHLGDVTDLTIRCQAMSVSRKFSIADADFVSFFSAGRALTLRVKRTTVVGGC